MVCSRRQPFSARCSTLAGARQHEGDITNIEFENNIFSDGALFESGLAYANLRQRFISPGSMTTFQVTIGYFNPVVSPARPMFWSMTAAARMRF